MYVGRIACVGLTKDGRLCAAYRVSSRSFPNRRAVTRGTTISVIPKPGHETDVEKNPYIAYNCARIECDGQVAIMTNGSHTDPIAEKIAAGVPVRDALVLASLALDYEHDQYNTPRISAVVDARDSAAWLGVVRQDGLEVARIPLEPGTCRYVATYEENRLAPEQRDSFDAASAAEACEFILGRGLFAQRSNPVTAVALMRAGMTFDVAIRDATVKGDIA